MGVSCTAYETVELIEARELSSMSDSDWDRVGDAGCVFLYNLDVFEDRGDGLPEGIYRTAGRTKEVSRSYGGYSRFRERLCQAVLHVDPQHVWNDYATYETRPFAPMIAFADNEGFLGPKTCARLAKDAADTMVLLPDSDDWLTWVEMFNLAADTGVIRYS